MNPGQGEIDLVGVNIKLGSGQLPNFGLNTKHDERLPWNCIDFLPRNAEI
jgi:hypothetical protein